MATLSNSLRDSDIMYDIIRDYNTPMDGEGPFFTDYLYLAQEKNPTLGLMSVDWDETTYTYLAKRKAKLIARFNREYAFRELGQETELRWQTVLQSRFDEVADHFNHMYKVFEENDVDILGTGYKITDSFKRTTADSLNTTDNRTGNSKFKDTPGSSASVLNNPTTETQDTTTDTYASNRDGEQKDERETNKTIHNDTMIDELNKLTDKYKSVDNEFIKSFENMFIGIITVGD